MFPTFISILDIQSWWEVPSIAHFCSLFRTAFNLLDFDIEDLEEALLTDGTEETSWLQELIVRLLSGCLSNNEISTFNYQMFLRRLFRQKCQEHDRYNPFNTDIDFTLLPLKTKVDILHALCDFRLDAEDVLDQLKNLEADSLRVEPLGYDSNDSAYWYFYGTRLYREDFKTKNNKKKSIWQVICFTEDDWFQLTKKFKSSTSKAERNLYHTLSKNFLPELPRLFKEKERQARRRLLENQPRRTSNRLRKTDSEQEKGDEQEKKLLSPSKEDVAKRRTYERELNERKGAFSGNESEVENEEGHDNMARTKQRKQQPKKRRDSDESSDNSKDIVSTSKTKRSKKTDRAETTPPKVAKPATVGRQTNNSLSAADGQIVIQPLSNPTKKKLKPSQVFRQTDEDLQVGMHKILDFVQNHEDAWPFADPVEEEYAPNYYTVIRKPMDLQKMEERLDAGYYKTFDKFRGDFQLIVANCRLYNGAENEYTEMVDNLQKVFERATERYLDQITSSEDEIAVEYLESTNDSKNNKRRKSDTPPLTTRGRKTILAASTDKKREKSEAKENRKHSDEESNVEEEKTKKSKKADKLSKKEEKPKKEKAEAKKEKVETKKDKAETKKDKVETKKDKFETKKDKIEAKKDKIEIEAKKEKIETKKDKIEIKKGKIETKKGKFETKKEKSEMKKDKAEIKKDKVEIKKEKETKKNKKMKVDPKKAKIEGKKEKQKGKKSKSKKSHKKTKKQMSPVHSISSSDRSRSPSPIDSFRSSPPPSWPPSSPEKNDLPPKKQGKKRASSEMNEDSSKATQKPSSKWDDLFDENDQHLEKKFKDDYPPYLPIPTSPKPKDKHNKLRETIEKLKAKSDISRIRSSDYDFDILDDLPKENKDKNKKEKEKSKTKDKNVQKPSKKESELEENVEGDKKPKKHQNKSINAHDSKTSSNFDALSIATEQTLKDINKWLDDTPKFAAEFSSASNSPSYGPLEDFDALTGKIEPPSLAKKSDKTAVKKEPSKDVKRKAFRDPSAFFKRREVQRTIDRLQPGKSKGNLITNVQGGAGKVDEMFPLGPLAKIKDTKNSLIVKTDTNAPKLSLGSVLDSIGKHKFVDDQKKDDEGKPEPEPARVPSEAVPVAAKPAAEKPEPSEPAEKAPAEDPSSEGGATPNLSAWFKAFGAPKAPPPPKKPEAKADGREAEKEDGKEKVAAPDPSPSADSPQPARQRRTSTGSSVSERSSFSQDLDSPRVGMDERGAFPYPSPLHPSPSGASTASPRPDFSPKYPSFNGQMRVGFYQDTVSNKSSPDKSCSPRDNPVQSPYVQYGSDHVYAPNTTQNVLYSYANSPYYTHAPNYSSTNPTPPYNMDASNPSYFDTSKSPSHQYGAKTYPVNSPVSNQSSPHSPAVQPQLSPSVHSQHSPSVHSQHSPSVHSPNVNSPQSSPMAGQASSPMESPNSPHGLQIVQQQQARSPGVQNEAFGQAQEQTQDQQQQQLKLEKQAQQQMQPQQQQQVQIQQQQQQQPIQQQQPVQQQQPQPVQQPQAVQQQQPPPVQQLQIQQQQTPMFPMKKRVYNESDPASFSLHEYEMKLKNAQQELMNRNLLLGQQINLGGDQQKEQQKNAAEQTTGKNYGAGGQIFSENLANFALNVPATRNVAPQPKIDMSKFTNMGYSGPEVNYSRALQQQFAAELSYTATSAGQQASLTTSQAQQQTSQAFKTMLSATSTQHGYGANAAHQAQSRSSENLADRLMQQEASLQRTGYNATTIDVDQSLLGRNMSNLSNIIDRFSNDERIMAGLQTTSSYYTDKGLGTAMFNKNMPIFSQANMAAMQQYNQNVQAASQAQQQQQQQAFGRQTSELQQAQEAVKNAQAQAQPQPVEKKSKGKRKNTKPVASSVQTSDQQQQQQQPQQGFQSYSNLKPSATLDPLKSSTVIAGSAFNFATGTAGLGLDAYPNFLEELRGAPNYYMAAAAAHHRGAAEGAKEQRAGGAAQTTAAGGQSFGFLGAAAAAQGRGAGYPIGSPFIAPAAAQAAQLMDTSSTMYQHYLQAGVLNQGLLAAPPAAYPPGYHTAAAALNMRQAYDSMAAGRAPWL